jgi:hypothetical protein
MVAKLESLDIDLRDNMYRMAVHILSGADVHKLHQVALQKAQEEGNKSKSINISQLSARSRERSLLGDEDGMISE